MLHPESVPDVNSKPTFSFEVFYTRSPGRTIQLLSPSTVGPELEKKAGEIARAYADLLRILFVYDSHQRPGYRRIQDGFAAACEGLSLKEWESLSMQGKDKIRNRRTSFYSPFRKHPSPPSLVLYIGGDRHTHLGVSPSYSADLASQGSASSTTSDTEFEAWDPIWDDIQNTGELPCNWGWHTRWSPDDIHIEDYIFVSGIYALWPLSSEREVTATTLGTSLHMTHLMVVLFHELVHATRTKLYGLSNLTPEKCIDHPHRVLHGQGEAGRLAEMIAFGTVVNLAIRNGKLLMFECENDKDSTPYELPSEVWECFFTGLVGRYNPSEVNTSRRNLSALIPERMKASAVNSEIKVNLKFPTQPPPQFVFPAFTERRMFPPDVAKQLMESWPWPQACSERR